MPIPAEQPRFDQPVVDARGYATQPWMNYWLRMASGSSQEGLVGRVDLLEAKVTELEQEASTGTFQIVGGLSIAVLGMPTPGGVVVLSLEGDVQSPPATSYYGTDGTGAKGWFLVASTIAVNPTELTKTVGTDGVSTFGLADVANTGTGSLLAFNRDSKGRVTGTKAATITGTTNQINVTNGDAVGGLPTISLADLANSGVGAALVKITRDAKGRVAGTQSATADDLPAGAANKYFPEAPIDGQTYGRKDGAWALVPGGGGAVTSVNARTGAVAVPDFVSKATAPTATDFGRPLIEGDRWFNTSNGVEYTYVGGAWVYDNAAALSRYMPAYLANGSASPVPLNTDGTVPAYLANGTYSPFATQA